MAWTLIETLPISCLGILYVDNSYIYCNNGKYDKSTGALIASFQNISDGATVNANDNIIYDGDGTTGLQIRSLATGALTNTKYQYIYWKSGGWGSCVYNISKGVLQDYSPGTGWYGENINPGNVVYNGTSIWTNSNLVTLWEYNYAYSYLTCVSSCDKSVPPGFNNDTDTYFNYLKLISKNFNYGSNESPLGANPNPNIFFISGTDLYYTYGSEIRHYSSVSPAPPTNPTNLVAICVTSMAPTAKFSTDKTSGKVPLTVQFNNYTTGSATLSYSWTFGDNSKSTDQNPSHQFTAAGTYTVKLTAQNSFGTNTYKQTIMVYEEDDIVTPPCASFTANKYIGLAPMTVQFTDSSTNSPEAWSWFFGDGYTSTSQNPSHTYSSNGTYTVTLMVTKDSGTWSSEATCQIVVTSETIAIPPVITSLGASATSGQPGLSISFTPTFSGGASTSYSWFFGDGYTSTSQNPSHTYSQSGIFTAQLTASNTYGSTTASIQITIVELTDQQRMPEGVTTTINGKKVGYFIVDSGNHRILLYEKAGTFIMSFGSFGNGHGQFNYPTRLTIVGAVQGLEKTEV